jgi:hypothetical protein
MTVFDSKTSSRGLALLHLSDSTEKLLSYDYGQFMVGRSMLL